MNKFVKNWKNLMQSDHNFLWILLIFVAVLISMSPMFFFGIPSGNDVHQHFQFAQIYYDSLLSGNFLPSWSAFENYGFGGIGTRFYPPLGYYALALARIVTGNWFDAAWLTFLFWMFVGCLGVYFWARELFSPSEAGLAGIFYALSPFHLAQIYQFFTYGEFVASALIPFCFLFTNRVCQRKKLTDILLLSFFYALLILSHIPSALIVSIALAIYSVTILDWRQFGKSILSLMVAISVGIFASSFHWIKIVTEKDWLNHASPNFSSGLYNYQDYFFPYSVSFSGNFWATYIWLLFAVTTFAGISLLLPTILSVFKKYQLQSLRDFKGALITGLAALLMATPLSSIIWQTFPILQKIQFPWRWFSVVTVIGTIALAGLLFPLVRSFNSQRIIIYSVLFFFTGLIVFNYLQVIIPSAPMSRNFFEQKLSNLMNEESFDCWWTVWAKKEAFANKEKVSVPNRAVTITKWERDERNFEVAAGEAEDLRVATFYYPYWKAKVNDEAVEAKLNEDGTILIPLRKESSTVQVFFDEPYFVKTAKIISFVSWTLLAIIGLFGLVKRFKNKSKLLMIERSYEQHN